VNIIIIIIHITVRLRAILATDFAGRIVAARSITVCIFVPHLCRRKTGSHRSHRYILLFVFFLRLGVEINGYGG